MRYEVNVAAEAELEVNVDATAEITAEFTGAVVPLAREGSRQRGRTTAVEPGRHTLRITSVADTADLRSIDISEDPPA